MQKAGDTPHGKNNDKNQKQSTPLLQWAGDTPHGNNNDKNQKQ
jgi:hypothetical protein